MASRGTTAVLVAGLAAQLSVATVGALPWFVLPLSAVGYVVAGLAAERAEGRRSDVLRGSGTALALIGLVALGPGVLSNADRVDIKEDLGMMLIIAQVGQALSWRSLRDRRSALMAAFGLLLLSASYAPDVLIGAPLLIGWVAVVCGLALLGGVGRVDAARATTVALAVGLAAFLHHPLRADRRSAGATAPAPRWAVVRTATGRRVHHRPARPPGARAAVDQRDPPRAGGLATAVEGDQLRHLRRRLLAQRP